LFWQAKWFASVSWLLAKAGGGTYPAEYGEPFVSNDKVHGIFVSCTNIGRFSLSDITVL